MLFENRSISISKNKANYTLKVKHNISKRFWEKTFKMIGNKRSGEDKITFYAHSVERLSDLLKNVVVGLPFKIIFACPLATN